MKNPFKKKQPRISSEIQQMAESLKRISEKLDILLKVVSYKGIDFPARYVDVPFVHEDGEEEINTYTVIDSNVANLIQWGIDNEEEEALCWEEDFWFSVSPEEFKSLTDDELIRVIQAMNGNLEDK